MLQSDLAERISSAELTEYIARERIQATSQSWLQAAMIARSFAGGKLLDHLPPRLPLDEAAMSDLEIERNLDFL